MNRCSVVVLVLVLVIDWVACLRGRGRGRGRVCSWTRCMRKSQRRLSMNLSVLPASCRQSQASD